MHMILSFDEFHYPYLCRLNLEWNNLEQGLKAFSEGIALNTSLKHLDLRSNCISHVGASHLASALLSNYTLEMLGGCMHVHKPL